MEKNVGSKQVNPTDLFIFKSIGKKIVCLTAYDFRSAQILDEAGVDLILIGDSLANVFLGLNDTYQIGMEEIIYHTKPVARAAKRALVVADMPFASYSVSIEEGVKNAAMLLRAGAKAVKLEGASTFTLRLVERLTEMGIPVIGHLGYTPQSSNLIGRGKVQGKTQLAAKEVFDQARALEEAGAIALVLELIPLELASEITQSLQIPTIGIGAGPHCDGQILVLDDALGKSDISLKFAKKYADLAGLMKESVAQYVKEVQEEKFPTLAQSFLSE